MWVRFLAVYILTHQFDSVNAVSALLQMQEMAGRSAKADFFDEKELGHQTTMDSGFDSKSAKQFQNVAVVGPNTKSTEKSAKHTLRFLDTQEHNSSMLLAGDLQEIGNSAQRLFSLFSAGAHAVAQSVQPTWSGSKSVMGNAGQKKEDPFNFFGDSSPFSGSMQSNVDIGGQRLVSPGAMNFFSTAPRTTHTSRDSNMSKALKAPPFMLTLERESKFVPASTHPVQIVEQEYAMLPPVVMSSNERKVMEMRTQEIEKQQQLEESMTNIRQAQRWSLS